MSPRAFQRLHELRCVFFDWEPVAAPAAAVGKLCSLATAVRAASVASGPAQLCVPSGRGGILGGRKLLWESGTLQMTGNLAKENQDDPWTSLSLSWVSLEVRLGCAWARPVSF